MSVKLQKEHIKLSRVISSRYCQTTTDCDIIVPDVKPDVLKVLRVSSQVAITEKTVQTQKVLLRGVVHLDILYIPDGNVMGNVKSISTTQDFSHTVDITEAKPGMSLVAEAECEPPEYVLVNSRKLSVRSKIGMNIKLTDQCPVDIPTSVEQDDAIRTRCEHLKICNTTCDAERDFSVRERLDVPSGKPDLGEILKLSVNPVSEELRLLDNKAIIKGSLCISTLYCSADEESSLQYMEHTIPFTEILEIDGIAENMTGEAEYFVKDISCEIERDSDGDKRIVSTQITLCVCIRTSEMIELDGICDAYGLEKDLIIKTEQYQIEHLIGTLATQFTEKENVAVPDYLPELHQIFDCTATPNIENIAMENSSATVSGYINCNILYMSSDGDMPLSGFSHVLPFSHTLDIPGLTPNAVCEAKAELDHLSYTIGGPRDIDLRVSVALNLKVVSPETHEFIGEISFDEESAPTPIPSAVVYFIQPGDTLWSIAKRYRTTPDALQEINDVDPHNLQIGSPIYVFR